MNLRNTALELAAIALVLVLVDVVCGVTFRIFDGHWPSLGFWLSGIFAYLYVALRATKRARKSTGDNGGS